MNTTNLVIPIIVPLLTAIVLALLNGRYRLEKFLATASMLYTTFWVFRLMYQVDTGGIQATVIGGWAAPYGIALAADRLTCIMLCLSMAVGSVAQIYTLFCVTEKQQKLFFYPLFFVLLVGVNWSFITGDLFNLFVGYEVMLVGSYGMMMLGASKQQVRETMKYIALNVLGSTIFVMGVGFVYALTGTLNFADLARVTADPEFAHPQMLTAAIMFLVVVFGMKTAAFPLFFWLPDSYPVIPAGVNGYFAGLLTKVGVYSLLRVFVMVFQQPGSELALQILLVLSGFTMLLGVLGAMCQWEIKKILSWHIISQVGYMVMGIGLAYNADIATVAIAGTIFYIVHHIIVKGCLFLVAGIAQRINGTSELKNMGGIIDLAPGTAGLFMVASFSLAGMPPFSGFFAKFVLIRAGLDGHNYIIVLVAMVTSFLTLFSMSKIWSYAFWRKPVENLKPLPYKALAWPTSLMVIFTIAMGLWAQPVLKIAERAADEVLNPFEQNGYVQTVLDIKEMPEFSGHGGHNGHGDSHDDHGDSGDHSGGHSDHNHSEGGEH